jgi:predicted dehydrogenase
MEKTIRWAVCGLGKISRRMVKAIRAVPGSTVAACVSSDKTRAERYGEELGIEHRLTYDELAANPGLVDAVYIATHMNAHTKPCILFLNAKIPVLCEKSFAVSVKSAESMIEAAKANDTLLMEAMWTRFLPATLKLQEILAAGKPGKIQSARARFEVGIGHGPRSRVFNRAVGGGCLLDIGIYTTTYTHMLLGVPSKITAEGRVKNGVDTSCNTVFEYPGGVTARCRVSSEFMSWSEYYRITCENAVIKTTSFYDCRKIVVKFNDGKKEVYKGFGKRYKPDGFIYEIAHFNDLIRNGIKESPVMTHKITLEVMTMLEEQLKQLGVAYD